MVYWLIKATMFKNFMAQKRCREMVNWLVKISSKRNASEVGDGPLVDQKPRKQ
jgi:hypothetical protein